MACEGEEDPAVSRFREYLCINTISSLDLKAPHQPDYGMLTFDARFDVVG